MVKRAGGYFGVPFKVQHGVTQGEPLYPMILNVVVDTVFWNWVTVVVATEGKADTSTEGFGWYIQWLEAYFYANDRLLAPTCSNRIHREFDILMEMFACVVL